MLESQAKHDVSIGNPPSRTSKAYIDMYSREYANANFIFNMLSKEG
jgi:hypothetical protein